MGNSNDISTSYWSLFQYICLVFNSSARTIFKKAEIAISITTPSLLSLKIYVKQSLH